MAISVDDPTVRLASHLSIKFSRVRQYETSDVRSVSGITVYNKMRARRLMMWRFTAGEVAIEHLLEIAEIHDNQRGKLRSFAFMDPLDYQLANELIGTGDGVETEFQAIKTYGSTNPYEDEIYLLRPGFVLTVAGTPNTDWTQTYGKFVFNSPPSGAIRITGEFDRPVNFMQDEFSIDNLASNGSFGTSSALDCLEVMPT